MATTATRPQATVPHVPRPESTRVRVPQLAIGLLVTAGAALVFVLWNASTTARSPVIALAVDVERGQVITESDLRVVGVGADDAIAVTPAEDAALIVGRTAVTDLPAGTLVTTTHVTSGPALTSGSGVVGLALPPGGYPTPGLTIGDLVDVLRVGEGTGATVLVERAEVVSVEVLGTQGLRFISLLAGEEAAAAVADAAAAGEVRLVLVADGADGERAP